MPPESTRRKSRRIAGKPAAYHEPLPQNKRHRSEQASPVTNAIEWKKLSADAKSRIESYRPIQEKQDAKLADLLNAVLDFLPAGGRESVARNILECRNDTELFDIYNNLFTALLLPSALSPLIYVIYSLTNSYILKVTSSLTDSPPLKRRFQDDSSPRTVNLRRECLLREDHRCAIRGTLDHDRWDELGRSEGASLTFLDVARIIPYKYASYKDADV